MVSQRRSVVPEGFSLDNTAQAVQVLDIVRVPAEQKLTDYFTSV